MKASEKNENIYTLLPRFVTEERNSTNYIKGKYLPAIARQFQWNNLEFDFIISPARICNEKGEDRHYYPGNRERLIEEGLRKLAIKENTNFRVKEFTLDFSLSQIMSYLKLEKCEVKLGILILADAKYELINGDSELYFRPIEKLVVREEDEDIYYRAQFSQLFFKRTKQFNFCFSGKNADNENALE